MTDVPENNSINEPPGSNLGGAPADPPTIVELTPAECVSGSEDFTLYIGGEGFTAASIILFAGQVEPTTLNPDGTLSTGVKPSLFAPAVVQVQIQNGEQLSDPVDFEFTEPVGTRKGRR
jgi:hypothetical protein